MKLNLKIFKYTLFFIAMPFSISVSGQENLKSQRPIISTRPVELDWRSIKISSVNYLKDAVDGGASIYSLHNSPTVKFKLTFVFPGGIFCLHPEDRTAFGALSDLSILGGFGNHTFDQFQSYATEHGINIRTGLTSTGQYIVTADAIHEDFLRTLTLVKDIILAPRFEKSAFELYKQTSIDGFKHLLDANTFDKQARFIEQEAMKLAFGKDHYFANIIERVSPKKINALKIDDIKKLHKLTINRNGLQVLISGKFTESNYKALKEIINKIPVQEIPVKTWLPSRNFDNPTNNKIRTEIISKSDMTQSLVTLRMYYPKLGTFNEIEQTQFQLIDEIYSATGGVIGNDRFTKALRADSGISYSPRASLNELLLFPNTDVGVFNMSFQSPNERLAEAVAIALKTWRKFLSDGITQDELDRARTSLMNRMLASEQTVFNQADIFFNHILRDEVPSVNPIQEHLKKLENQRSAKEINKTLQKLANEKIIPILVIMGNPSSDQIETLKKQSNIEVVGIKTLDKITQDYY